MSKRTRQSCLTMRNSRKHWTNTALKGRNSKEKPLRSRNKLNAIKQTPKKSATSKPIKIGC
jgi:hypothetical protein